MSESDALFLVPAGGRGERLGHLTSQRAKPSLALTYDEKGGVQRMIDVPLKAIQEIGATAIVSAYYMAHSLGFVRSRDYVTFIEEDRPKTPVETLHDSIQAISSTASKYIGVLPGDAFVDSHTLSGMRISLEATGANAVILSTNHLDGHNTHYINKDGFMTTDNTGRRIADLGVHLFQKDWLLDRLVVLDQTHNDVWALYGEEVVCDVVMYVPDEDPMHIDMGTIPALRTMIYKLNQQHVDDLGNLVFPGAYLSRGSTNTVALPNTKTEIICHNEIIPEECVL